MRVESNQRQCASALFTSGDSHRIVHAASLVALALLHLSIAMGNKSLFADDDVKPAKVEKKPRADVNLSDDQQKRLTTTLDRALEYLAAQQTDDGSFASNREAQPAITSLCVMAFLSRGYSPQEGPYKEPLVRAIDFVLTTQRKNGMLYSGSTTAKQGKLGATYNHAIAGVMLSEAYDTTDSRQHPAIRSAIEKGLLFSQAEQEKKKRYFEDRGGWRYLRRGEEKLDADLSVTAWHLMFYRSALNSSFHVPKEDVDEAIAYVERCYNSDVGSFSYGLRGSGLNDFSRAMAGAGIISLALSGKRNSAEVKGATRFVLAHPFDAFNGGGTNRDDRFFYSAFYCSQAVFQIDGDAWKEFYAQLLETMAANQNDDGSWDAEAVLDSRLGQCYSTSLAILSLTPPLQKLPIYLR